MVWIFPVLIDLFAMAIVFNNQTHIFSPLALWFSLKILSIGIIACRSDLFSTVNSNATFKLYSYWVPKVQKCSLHRTDVQLMLAG